MKERPILFSGPMVRALLDGSKGQTRRVVKLPHNNPLGQWEPTTIGGPNGGRTKGGLTIPEQGAIWHTRTGDSLMCPHGQPGDRLWVRETFAHIYRDNAKPESRSEEDVAYAADGLTPDRYAYGTWKPSIHMPRWASRITLEVTGVRVERLQDISETDAIAEGIRQHDQRNGWVNECTLADGKRHFDASAYGMFKQLWSDINGAESWDANPWVWVIEFKRVTSEPS